VAADGDCAGAAGRGAGAGLAAGLGWAFTGSTGWRLGLQRLDRLRRLGGGGGGAISTGAGDRGVWGGGGGDCYGRRSRKEVRHNASGRRPGKFAASRPAYSTALTAALRAPTLAPTHRRSSPAYRPRSCIRRRRLAQDLCGQSSFAHKSAHHWIVDSRALDHVNRGFRLTIRA
jgi:hypothetical protein